MKNRRGVEFGAVSLSIEVKRKGKRKDKHRALKKYLNKNTHTHF